MSLLISLLSQILCINRDKISHEISSAKPKKCSQQFEDDVKCCVCLSRLEKDDTIRKLPCSHVFHQDCVNRWLAVCQKTCPLCRVSVDYVETSTINMQEQLNDEMVMWFSSMIVPGF
ncbi:hypothetical protein LUZ60_016190 [Juncus effusus]|nr:hypothetical protein LUZ60_016190 [Juncus effusus]